MDISELALTAPLYQIQGGCFHGDDLELCIFRANKFSCLKIIVDAACSFA